jgi:glycerophosphoryl diester phosphodiesterase
MNSLLPLLEAQINRSTGQRVIFSTFETAQMEILYRLQDELTHLLLAEPKANEREVYAATINDRLFGYVSRLIHFQRCL